MLKGMYHANGEVLGISRCAKNVQENIVTSWTIWNHRNDKNPLKITVGLQIVKKWPNNFVRKPIIKVIPLFFR